MELLIFGLIVLGLIGDESKKVCEGPPVLDEPDDDSSEGDDDSSKCAHGYDRICCLICGPPENFY